MPKSKRSKLISLTQTEKKGHEGKEKLYNEIQESLAVYKYIWLFSIENMRNSILKQVRTDWKDSRIFLGRTKVMAKALGLSPQEELKDNLSKLALKIQGEVGLLFTNDLPNVVIDYFNSYSKSDFARAGATSEVTFIIPKGIIYSRAGQIPTDEDVPLPHNLEPNLRQLGLNTSFKNGHIVIDNDYTVCNENDIIDSRQSRLLKLFGVTASQFRVKLISYYDSDKSDVIDVSV